MYTSDRFERTYYIKLYLNVSYVYDTPCAITYA